MKPTTDINKSVPSAEETELGRLFEAAVAADRANLTIADAGDRTLDQLSTTQPITTAEPAQPQQGEASTAKEPAPKVEATSSDPPAKPTKAERDQERRDRTWKQINEEKTRLAQEREAIEAQRLQLEQTRQSGPVKSEEDKQAEQYDQLASQYRSEGNEPLAAAAVEQARKLRQTAQDKVARAQHDNFRKVYEANFHKVAEVETDLYDNQSDLYKQVDALIKAEPILQNIPDGVAKAVGIVRDKLAVARVPDLEAKLKAQAQEIEQLNKKLALTGSFPQDEIPEGKPFDSMTIPQQVAYMQQQAARIDREQMR